MTKEECKHIGVPFNTPPIVKEFIASKFSKRNVVKENDFLAHHRLVEEFCLARLQRKKKSKKNLKCSWTQVL